MAYTKQSHRKEKFLEYVEKVIRAYLDDDLIMCPHCGSNLVDPWSKAGSRFGICDVCYTKLKVKAQEQAYSLLTEQRAYDAMRKKVHRLRKELEENHGNA